MKFTGKNLVFIRECVEAACSDIRSHIGHCPDVFEYAEDLEVLEAQLPN